MRRKIIGIFVCMLMTLLVFSFTTIADPGPELEIKIVGGLPLPYFTNYVGGLIGNIGDAPAYDVSYNMTIQGGVDGAINKRIAGYTDEISRNNGYAVSIIDTFGFGPVTIIITASSTNAKNVTGTAKGFQIGGFTWIPFSWLSLLGKEYYS
jgi:hypothetical protein